MQFWTKVGNTMRYLNTPPHGTELELSPVFFDARVLSKYKSEPSKYEITFGAIICMDEGWILRSCYPSSNNEIYVYLYDLFMLPKSEQHYWQTFNLKNPVGKQNPIAIRRDFYCSFENSKKEDLAQILYKLSRTSVKIGSEDFLIWNPKEKLDEMVNEIAMPLIEEKKQYRDEFLLPLARLVVEGFIVENLKKWANVLDVTLEQKDGSLTILEKCLSSFVGEDKAKNIIFPLKMLQKEKSALSSHGGKQPNQNMIQKSEDFLDDIINSFESIAYIICNLPKASCPLSF